MLDRGRSALRFPRIPGTRTLTAVHTRTYATPDGRLRVGSGKGGRNLKKHEVDFADAAISLEDLYALTDTDPDASEEERYICLGADPEGRLLVTVYTYRDENIRIISSRLASPGERRRYEER